MKYSVRSFRAGLVFVATASVVGCDSRGEPRGSHTVASAGAIRRDMSPRLDAIIASSRTDSRAAVVPREALAQVNESVHAASNAEQPHVPAGSAQVEQRSMGSAPAPQLVSSFDGLGAGFKGPHGVARVRNPSDNSLAVGRDHIMQTVNSRLAIFSKAGGQFDSTGVALYGPVPNNLVFSGFGGACEVNNNGDTVVRYDQLANRWLIVMPIFARGPERDAGPPLTAARAVRSVPGQAQQPGAALAVPPPPIVPPAAESLTTPRPREAALQGPYGMCYALSSSDDPMGPWYRYEFVRALFPDYPRPAVWPDGYYVPSSTGDEIVEKHACVVDRASMLRGDPATEQCILVPGVNFLNNADLDGHALPPAGMPNVMIAAGGTQLQGVTTDSVLLAWSFHVNWRDPSRTRLTGPQHVRVAPYRYLCDGQLTKCVPQPGTDVRLDAQGDKIMARVVYRRIGDRQSLVAVHSVNTSAGGGGVRWYELHVNPRGVVSVAQQGTYAPDSLYRWMASPAMDKFGNIGVGYSFGGTPHFAGQRFAARQIGDAPGSLPMAEIELARGAAPQTTTLRWQDYTQTAIDPVDDCTIWYVGDYLKEGESAYSTRIGAFHIPPCGAR